MKDCWKKNEKKVKIIGIAGAIRGSGATHLSIALANYTASGLGEKTACLELGGHGEMSHWKAAGTKGYFTDAKIDYYPDLKKEQIPVLLNCGYETIIMDFGDAYKSYQGELLRCDRKIMLLNLNPWQEFAARKLVQTVPFYAGVNVQKSVKKAVEREFKISVMELPSIPDPTCIRSEQFSCMNLILACDAVNYKRRKL